MFITEGPVPPESPYFAGRQAALKRMETWLNDPHCVGAVVGARQTGKTSLLLKIRHTLRQKYAFVFVDLQAIKDAGEAMCFSYLGAELCRQLAVAVPDRQLLNAGDGPTFLALLREIARLSPAIRIVVMIDEIGALPAPTAERLAHSIRSCFNTRQTQSEYQRFVFILSGSTDMLTLTSGRLSPLRNVTDSLYVEDLTADETDALLQYGFSEAGVAVPQNVRARVYDWTHGHPYLTQHVGQLILNKAASPALAFSDALVDDVVRDILAEEGKNLPHLRGRLANGSGFLWPYVQHVLAGERVPFSRSDPCIAELELSGFLRNESGASVVRNKVYREAVKHWLPPTPPPPSLIQQIGRRLSRSQWNIIVLALLTAGARVATNLATSRVPDWLPWWLPWIVLAILVAALIIVNLRQTGDGHKKEE